MVASPRARRRRALVVAAALGSLGLLAPGAIAQPAPSATAGRSEPSAADKDTARHLMDVGDAHFEAGEYEAALKAYGEADRLMRVPTTGAALGRAQEKLGKLVEARDTLLRVGRYPREPREPKAFTEARQQAVALAEALKPRVPSLRFEIVGPAAGTAEVLLGDEVVSGAGLEAPRLVDPGQLRARCRAEGFIEASQTVTLAEGEHRVLRFDLAPDPVEPAPKPTPKPAPKPAPPPAVAPDTGGSGGPPLWTWVGFGFAGAGAIAGTITGVMSLSRVSDLDDACPDKRCTAEQQGDIDTMNTLANVSNVSFAVAGAGLVVGIVGLLVGGSDAGPAATSGRRGLRLRPAVGPGTFFLAGDF